MTTSVRPNRRIETSSITRQDKMGTSRTNSMLPSGSSLRWCPTCTPPWSHPAHIYAPPTPPGRPMARGSATVGSVVWPEQIGQSAGQVLELGGRRFVALGRPAVRVGHVVGRRMVGQRRAGTVALSGPDPGGQFLPRQPGTYEFTPRL